MPAAKYAKTGKGPKGPAGTAAQRATKSGSIRGRTSAAQSSVAKGAGGTRRRSSKRGY